jgi:GT2 family glycosyltransferase
MDKTFTKQDIMLGIVVVTYNSADVIENCLNSLAEAGFSNIRVLICDNASPDDTIDRINSWSRDRGILTHEWRFEGDEQPEFKDLNEVTILHTGANRGYAGGVNAGLSLLSKFPEITHFWILNPDTEVDPNCPSAFADAIASVGRFGLMGGRVQYRDEPGLVQSDGGQVSHWFGVCRNVNQGIASNAAAVPDPSELDFISGACLVASRQFFERVGPMREDYFLYYEEVDWAFRRGDLPLVTCKDALVHHLGGTSIGSGAFNRRASAFSNYFNYRSRLRFVARFFPLRLPFAYIYSISKVFQLLMLFAVEEAYATFCGMHQLPPPKTVSSRLSSDALTRISGNLKKKTSNSREV